MSMASLDEILGQLRALAATDAAAARALARLEPADSFEIGLADEQLSGWYNEETDELGPGFRISADDVVADIGCGDGGPGQFCAKRGAHVILADIDADALARAEALCTGKGARALETFVTDSDPLPLADGIATRVVCMEVLEHVDDPEAVLRELVRIGAPGALYLLSVPDVTGERLQQVLAPPSYFAKPNHLRIFERDEFAALVEGAGLVVERRSYHGFYWAMWWLLFWECDVPLGAAPDHPVLDAWARCWRLVSALPNGLKIRDLFDRFMPRNQAIVARKPG